MCLITRIEGGATAHCIAFKSPKQIQEYKILVSFDKSKWIHLQNKAAGIELNLNYKPTVILGEKHGYLWIKDKSLIYAFGDNSFNQMGIISESDMNNSLGALHMVSFPIGTQNIYPFNTFTAIIANGDLYINGLFMV